MRNAFSRISQAIREGEAGRSRPQAAVSAGHERQVGDHARRAAPAQGDPAQEPPWPGGLAMACSREADVRARLAAALGLSTTVAVTSH